MTNVALKLLLDQDVGNLTQVNPRVRGKAHLFSLIAELAYHSMLVEVHLSPKPGLVDLINNGSHSDMDVALFEASADAIRPFLNDFLYAGFEHSQCSVESLIDVLRPIGLKAENAMFNATSGVNTHKGMIFSLGLVCGAVGWLVGKGITIDANYISQVIKQSCSLLIVRELDDSTKVHTHGQRLYREFGLTGARGEAARGYQTVLTYSLPAYQTALSEGASAEEALWQSLVTLMAYNQDTNVVSRGGMHGLRYVQNMSKKLLMHGGWLDPQFEGKLIDFDRELIKRNLSPGGSADLLAITWLLAEIEPLSQYSAIDID